MKAFDLIIRISNGTNINIDDTEYQIKDAVILDSSPDGIYSLKSLILSPIYGNPNETIKISFPKGKVAMATEFARPMVIVTTNIS